MARMVASSFTRLSTQFTTRLLSTTATATAAALSKPSSLTWRHYSSCVLLDLPYPTFHRPTEFPGLDFNHWVIVMDTPGGEGASKQQMIDCYIETLAKVLGSEEEAKKKIYNVFFEGDEFGFGCEIDKKTLKKLKRMPGVMFAIPDSYIGDPENKDYGGELLVNGKIVQRPPRGTHHEKNLVHTEE